MSNLFKATRSATNVTTKAIPVIAKQAFTTSHSGPRWPSSMDDLPMRTNYIAKVLPQTISTPAGLTSKTRVYDLSIERIHPGCVPRESRKSTGVEEREVVNAR
ncbi:hypothetical protein EG328_002656 [Venturia inaequalis]|uniref:Uncharacterized protein n=1 Tax=Venturia inaequalis TaxID=5025 RepID=A0A8H3VCJ4_VENIN|nr:hypothetical protein EG328_002656 [Venturia inaequalis]KAE9985236.1 hypothetical protein EG327_004787 [Venturia inaequalis]RDI86716.1 hypothetical protein Vi05172_g3304 [Venturia inaequalis]